MRDRALSVDSAAGISRDGTTTEGYL